MSGKLNIIASITLLCVLLLTPALAGYIHSFLSSLTHQKIVSYVEDSHLVQMYLKWYNSTAGTWMTDPQDWTYDPDEHKIIIAAIEQSGPTDTAIDFYINLNGSYFTGAWLWDNKIEHIKIFLSLSTNITVSTPLCVYVYDDTGTGHAREFSINETGCDIDIDIAINYATRAWFASYSGQTSGGTGMTFMLKITEPADLNGEYMEMTMYFTRTEQDWVAGVSDYVVASIGILLFIAGVFATPYVSVKDVRKLFSRRRR